MSTIVTGNIDTLQLFALIATLVFVGAGIAAVIARNAWGTILSAGLALASIALMFHP